MRGAWAARGLWIYSKGTIALSNVPPRKPRQAVLLFYPVQTAEEHKAGWPASVGFAPWLPANDVPPKLGYKVLDRRHAAAVVIDTPGDSGKRR
jgi:hypothetical protein